LALGSRSGGGVCGFVGGGELRSSGWRTAVTGARIRSVAVLLVRAVRIVIGEDLERLFVLGNQRLPHFAVALTGPGGS